MSLIPKKLHLILVKLRSLTRSRSNYPSLFFTRLLEKEVPSKCVSLGAVDTSSLLGGSSMSTTKPPRLTLCFVFPMYRCFGPGPFVLTLSNPPLDPLPLPVPFLDRTPSSFEPGIFSTLQQLRNLFSPGT